LGEEEAVARLDKDRRHPTVYRDAVAPASASAWTPAAIQMTSAGARKGSPNGLSVARPDPVTKRGAWVGGDGV
jgi:hypothetical protein